MICVLVVALVALRTTIAAALVGFVLPLTSILLSPTTLFTLGRPLLRLWLRPWLRVWLWLRLRLWPLVCVGRRRLVRRR